MHGADYRAELHFAVRREVDDGAIHSVARFMANLATYPFHHQVSLDWWHKIRDPGRIPLFNGAESILLHPAFVEGGWDLIETVPPVRLLNVVPISGEASKLRTRASLSDYLWNDLRDPFLPW